MSEPNGVSSSKLNLLLLDDEDNVLKSLWRLLRRDYNIASFSDGQEALNYMSDNDVHLIVSDMRMPKMSGSEFLEQARLICPNAYRILLTGYSDIDSTISAINEGGIYSYISKPWDNDNVKLSLKKAAEHYLLELEKKQLMVSLANANDKLATLNNNLESKVKQRTQALQVSKKQISESLNNQKSLLNDVLEMLSATIEYRTELSASHIQRIAKQCRALASEVGLDKSNCNRIYFCAMLHEIGMVGLTDKILADIDITNSNDEAGNRHPEIGAEIVGRVKRFAALAEIIKHQNENINGTGLPDHLSGENIPIGARIIRIVKDFDYLIAGKSNSRKVPIVQAQSWMAEKANIFYDRQLLKSFNTMLLERSNREDLDMEYSIGTDCLKNGDILTEDLVLGNGNVMIKAGQSINESMIGKIKQYENANNTKVTLFTN